MFLKCYCTSAKLFWVILRKQCCSLTKILSKDYHIQETCIESLKYFVRVELER